jgi:hypothetical protein
MSDLRTEPGELFRSSKPATYEMGREMSECGEEKNITTLKRIEAGNEQRVSGHFEYQAVAPHETEDHRTSPETPQHKEPKKHLL